METGMSSGQALALCVATSITGSLSLLGSGTIIYCILKEEFPSSRQNDARRQPRRRQRLLKRFLLTLRYEEFVEEEEVRLSCGEPDFSWQVYLVVNPDFDCWITWWLTLVNLCDFALLLPNFCCLLTSFHHLL